MKRDNLNKFNITNEITDNLGIPRVYSEQIIKNLRNKGLKSKIIIPLPELKIIDWIKLT